MAQQERLIKAAPALYAALARLVAWHDAGCDPSRQSLDQAREALRTARDATRGGK